MRAPQGPQRPQLRQSRRGSRSPRDSRDPIDSIDSSDSSSRRAYGGTGNRDGGDETGRVGAPRRGVARGLPHSVRYALHIARQTEPRGREVGFGGVRTQGSLRTAFLDIIGLLLNRTLMKKGDVRKKDDALDLLRAIRSYRHSDYGLILQSDVNPPRDRVSMQKRINNFRNRFVASIVADTDDEARRDVYANILGKLYAAAARANVTGLKSSSAEIARRYAESLLASLRLIASAETLARGAATSTRKATTKSKAAVSRGVQAPRAAGEPSASRIREVRESDAVSELLRTGWWPEEMHLLWIYEQKGLKTPAFDALRKNSGKEKVYAESTRALFVSRMLSDKLPVVANRVLKATKKTAMDRLRDILHVEQKARFPSTIIFDLRGAKGPEKPKSAEGAGTEDEDEPTLKDAIAKFAKWLPHLGTMMRPVCAVVISDDPDDATHAAIALDSGTAETPHVASFIESLTNEGALDEAVDDDANVEDTLSTAVYYAGFPVGDADYAPVRWQKDYRTGPAARKPTSLSLVSADAPASGPGSVRYQPKDLRLFLEGSTPLPMVPDVRVSDETAISFIPFLAYGRTDHASNVRVIDATALTMPSDRQVGKGAKAGGAGKVAPEESKRNDLNVALLLAVAMDTPSVLIVTEEQRARMRLELEWMDRVFAAGADTGGKGARPGADTGGKGAGPGADTGGKGASSAAAGSPSQPPKAHSARSKSASPSADLPPRKSPLASSTVEATVDEDDGATVAGAGTGKGGKSGVYFKIFRENLRIVKHGEGAECPGNMLRAAAEHMQRLAQTESGDKLEFLVGIRLSAAGKSVVTNEHHSTTGDNASSIYLRCAPAGTDGPLDLDYPEPSSGDRHLTSDQDEIARIVNEAMRANTKIFIVCMEAGAKQPAVEGSVGTSPSQSWGYY